MTTLTEPATTSHVSVLTRGPFSLLSYPQDPGNWFLMYLEDSDEPEAWDELLELDPEFARSVERGSESIETATGQVLKIEHWSVSHNLRVIAAN